MSEKSNPNLLRKPQAAAMLGVSTRQFDRLRKRYHLDPVPHDQTGRKNPLFWWASVIEELANGGYAWGDDARQTILPPCRNAPENTYPNEALPSTGKPQSGPIPARAGKGQESGESASLPIPPDFDWVALTATQVAILDHTVHHAPRGIYCGGGPEMEGLVEMGMMESAAGAEWCPYDFYRITSRGFAALNSAKEMGAK